MNKYEPKKYQSINGNKYLIDLMRLYSDHPLMFFDVRQWVRIIIEDAMDRSPKGVKATTGSMELL